MGTSEDDDFDYLISFENCKDQKKKNRKNQVEPRPPCAIWVPTLPLKDPTGQHENHDGPFGDLLGPKPA